LIKRLQTGLSEYEFEYFKKGAPYERQFRRVTPFGCWRFHAQIGRSLSFEIHAGVGLRLEALENLVHEDEKPEWAHTTQTLFGDLGYLSEGPPPVGRQLCLYVCQPELFKAICDIVSPKYHKWIYPISQIEDLDAVCKSVLDLFLTVGLPFLEKYSVTENALELLSRDDTEARLHHMMDAERAKRAIGLALLLGKGSQFRKLAETKTAFLRELVDSKRGDPKWHEGQLQSFLRFKQKLENQLPKPTVIEKSQEWFDGCKNKLGGWLANVRNTRVRVNVSFGEPERVKGTAPSSAVKTVPSLLPSSGPLYASIVIVGKATPPLWFYEKWARIAGSLDPLVAAVGGDIGVRTTQDDQNKKQPLFGKLDWNERSHRKWTHNSPDSLAVSTAWRFMIGEVWAPRWTVCTRENREPDLFMSFENPHLFSPPKPGQYNQFFHLALPVRFYREHESSATNAVLRIAQELDAVLLVMRIVPFLVKGDSIQDTLNNHFHYIGMQDDMVPDLSRTEGRWIPYDPKRIVTVQQA